MKFTIPLDFKLLSVFTIPFKEYPESLHIMCQMLISLLKKLLAFNKFLSFFSSYFRKALARIKMKRILEDRKRKKISDLVYKSKTYAGPFSI